MTLEKIISTIENSGVDLARTAYGKEVVDAVLVAMSKRDPKWKKHITPRKMLSFFKDRLFIFA